MFNRSLMRLRAGLGSALVVLALMVAACGEGGQTSGGVTDLGQADSSESATESSSASASASASGISEDELVQRTDNALIAQAVDGYRAYVATQIADLQAETRVFADAVRADDIEAAKAAYPISRRSWERIEPIAGLIEDIDVAVDAREDDFDGPTDPDFTGWHRLEYLLWVEEDVSDAGRFADRLEADLQTLADAAVDLDLPPGVLTVGAQELIEEIATPDGKLSGEEERYSGTDLYSFQANVEGSEALVELLAPALAEVDPELLADIESRFAELNQQLAQFGSFDDGFVNYIEVTQAERAELAATLGGLAESLSQLNGALGLG